jgi:hypothetical protein
VAICYCCGKNTFLSVHVEEIDGEEREVCGQCKNIVCIICGKSRREDGIRRWSYQKHPETGDIVTIGDCCTKVEGKVDIVRRYFNKYHDLEKSRPDIIEKLDEQAAQNTVARKNFINDNKGVADKMIDNWRDNKAKGKIIKSPS